MQPTTLMLIGVCIALFALVATIINFTLLVKNMGESFFLCLVVHIILGVLWTVGCGSIVGGFVWFLIDKYNK